MTRHHTLWKNGLIFLQTLIQTFLSPQRFPLGGDDEVMSSTLQQFAKVIDEVRTMYHFQFLLFMGSQIYILFISVSLSLSFTAQLLSRCPVHSARRRHDVPHHSVQREGLKRYVSIVHLSVHHYVITHRFFFLFFLLALLSFLQKSSL